MSLAFALRMPSPVWINIAPEKSFQSIRSLSTQPSSQSHYTSIHFLIEKIFIALIVRFSRRENVLIDLNTSYNKGEIID